MNERVFVEVDSVSLANTRRELRDFAPLLLVTLDEVIKSEADVVAREAGQRLASLAQTHSGEENAAGAYVVKQRAGLVQILNATRGAAILEFAGSVHPQGMTPRGRSLIATLDERYGPTGRLMWQAWDHHAEVVTAKVQTAVVEAQAALQRLLDGV